MLARQNPPDGCRTCHSAEKKGALRSNPPPPPVTLFDLRKKKNPGLSPWVNLSPRDDIRFTHHSDQGSQYASASFGQVLQENHIAPSMSRKGNCYDNAVVESFFKSLKAEIPKEDRSKTREETKSRIFEYIEVFYNRKRLHSTLGYQSPAEYERIGLTKLGVH